MTITPESDATIPSLSPECESWFQRYEERQRRRAELRPTNKAAVFDALAAAGVATVIVSFDGYGDSGQIEGVEARDGDSQVALPQVMSRSPSRAMTRKTPSIAVIGSTKHLRSSPMTRSAICMAAGKITTEPMASSCSMLPSARSTLPITSVTRPPKITSTSCEGAMMGHPYHHALSSVRKWGGAADDYLPLHQWFDESKAITADFRHRALRHHAEGIFMLERFFGIAITLSTGRVVPVRLIGEQHVREDLGFIPSFADWVRCIRPEPWMGRAQPIHKLVDPFAIPDREAA